LQFAPQSVVWIESPALNRACITPTRIFSRRRTKSSLERDTCAVNTVYAFLWILLRFFSAVFFFSPKTCYTSLVSKKIINVTSQSQVVHLVSHSLFDRFVQKSHHSKTCACCAIRPMSWGTLRRYQCICVQRLALHYFCKKPRVFPFDDKKRWKRKNVSGAQLFIHYQSIL